MLFAFHRGNATSSNSNSNSNSSSTHNSRSIANTNNQNGIQEQLLEKQQSQQPQLISFPFAIEPIDNNHRNLVVGDSSFWRSVSGPSSSSNHPEQLQGQQPPKSSLSLRVVEEESASIIPPDSSSSTSTSTASTSNNSMSSRSSQGSSSQSSFHSSSEHTGNHVNSFNSGTTSLTPMMNRLGPSYFSSSSSSAPPSGLQLDEQSTISRLGDTNTSAYAPNNDCTSNSSNSRPPLFSMDPPPCASTSTTTTSDREIVQVQEGNNIYSSSSSSSPQGDYSLLSSDQLASLERLTRLATRLTGVPVAIISRTSSSKTGGELQVLSHYGLDKVSWSQDDVYQVLKLPGCGAATSSSSSSTIPFCQHVPLTTTNSNISPPQAGCTKASTTTSSVVVGTLSLLASQPRSPLTLDERQDLEDLTFLAGQALSSTAATSSNNDQSEEAASGTPPLSSSGHNQIRRKVSAEAAVSPSAPSPANDNSYQHHHKAQRRATPPPIRRPSFQKQHQNHKRTASGDLSTATVSSVLMNNHEDEEEASRCIIACTAHDLLTPLMGLQLSLSLLQEDPKFVRHLEEQPLQRESFWTAWQSTEVMFRMCQTTIDALRANKQLHEEDDYEDDNDDVAGERLPSAPTSSSSLSRRRPTEICNLDLTVLLQSLQRLMDPIPKRVPLSMILTKYVPDRVPVITTTASTSGASNIATDAATTSETVDWHILRCAMTILSHACRVSSSSSNEQQQRKAIQMRIKITGGSSSSSSTESNGKNKGNRNKRLVIECEHDCPDLDIDMTASLYASPASLSSAQTLALKSIAYQMENVYGGQHGFTRPQMDQSRAIFWFSVLVSSSESASSSRVPRHDRVITLAPTPMRQEEGDTVRTSRPLATTSRTVDDNEDVAMMMMDCKKTGSPKQASRPNHTTKLPSPLWFNGPRRRRRSSTGTTNVLGGRRRTFNDMLGLRREGGARTTGLELTKSVKVLPTMFRCQSHANHNWNDGSHSNKAQHRNYQYSSNTCGNARGGNKIGTGLATSALTAQTAMAAAIQTSLVNISTPQGASDPTDLGNSSFGCRDALNDDNCGNRRLSYSTIQEEARLLEEKALVKPLFGGSDNIRSTSGLERCFQDIMGSTVAGNVLQSSKSKETINNVSGRNGQVPCTAERVRERILSQQQRSAYSAKPALAMASTASSLSPQGGLRERKALVIDDSLVIRKTVARALTKLGVHTVLQACDGVEGVQRMKEDVFEIVLCDFSMPNLGGIDCVKQYRQWESEAGICRPRQHIVGMSAHASPGDITQGLKVGMNEYQPKPLTIKRLGELLESLPVKNIREQLDSWNGEGSSDTNDISTKKGNLFAAITASTVSMLDAMNSSSKSASYGDSVTDGGALKRPKTEGLFSLSSS